jgi:L-iditol 2-dehydrogenase
VSSTIESSAHPAPTTMRASVLAEAGVVRVETRPRPSAGPGEVLVRVAAVGVCGSDVHYYEHGRVGPYVVEQPLILGHELSGVIVEVGERVNPARVGERVAVEPQRPCRSCRECRRGRYNLCAEMRFYATPPIDGAFAEFVTIEADFAHAIPDSVSDQAAALMEPLSVAIAACRRARIAPGHRVLIAGAGPIGVITAQTARAFGASEVYISDLVEKRLEFALRFGATRALRPGRDGTAGLDVDAFIDASGAPSAISAGIRAVGPGGYAILVGLGNDTTDLPISYIQDREIWVSGVFRYVDTWPVAIQLVESGAVDLDSLVTSRFGLAEAETALIESKSPDAMKVIVTP